MFRIQRPYWDDELILPTQNFFSFPSSLRTMRRNRADFLRELTVKHLRDDWFYVKLPLHVPFHHVHFTVSEDDLRLQVTYLPTKDSVKFQLPENVDVGAIEAKRFERDHFVLLRIPIVDQDQGIEEGDNCQEEKDRETEQNEDNTSEYQQEHFAEGDVELEEYVEPSKHDDEDGVVIPVLTAIHPETSQELYFEEVKIPKDHDCAFHCLDISRESACDLLMKHKESLDVRRLVAPEIQESFIGCQLPKEMESMKEVQLLREAFVEANEKISSALRKAKERLEELGIPCKDMDAKDIVMKFGRCQSATILKVVKELVEQLNMLKSTENRISQFCTSKQAFEAFITYYLRVKGSWAGYLRSVDGKHRTSSLDAIALLKGMKLFIWVASQRDSSNLELVHESPEIKLRDGTEETEVIHMFHTDNLSHFNLLQEI